MKTILPPFQNLAYNPSTTFGSPQLCFYPAKLCNRDALPSDKTFLHELSALSRGFSSARTQLVRLLSSPLPLSKTGKYFFSWHCFKLPTINCIKARFRLSRPPLQPFFIRGIPKTIENSLNQFGPFVSRKRENLI